MSSHLHPRRRLPSPTIDDVSESLGNISLRKGSTFHPSTHDHSDLFNPFLGPSRPLSLPSRSATCPKALEDLLIGAGERRAVELLRRVDDASNNQELSTILSEPEVLPVPRFIVEHAATHNNAMTDKHHMDVQESPHHHRADSGIGSSINDSIVSKLRSINGANTVSTRSAVTKSFSSVGNETSHGLSDFSQQQIHEHFVKPILAEASLKDFHGLIKDIPIKIGSKEITTLRDLEKTLIFLAPEYSRSPAAYRSFCETSIQCLHLTVDGVPESDRCLPTDRPYSPGYFIDLVEQIRRYASILAATRAKEERGEELDEMDAKPTDKLELKGGMTHNGKPGFLVRTTSTGKHINMASDRPMSSNDLASSSAKRPMDLSATDDDGASRSMARRKKNAPPGHYPCEVAGCTSKAFTRPCDLTKHLKTHVRPFKCPEAACKYHEHGWPTEKERDRHYNDKHSDSPNLYQCFYKGCPYTSKRESNCKQHMEKSHGWEYERSKSNGKQKGKGKAVRIPATNASSSNGSPGSASFTPIAPSPLSVISNDTASNGNTFISPPTPAFDFANFNFGGEFNGHFNTDFLQTNPYTPAFSDASAGASASPFVPYQANNNAYDEVMKTEEFENALVNDFSYQQPTPESIHGLSHSHPASLLNVNMAQSNFGVVNNISPHISPGAEGLTLTSPQYGDSMTMDEGFGDGFGTDEDFQLFSNMPANTNDSLFPDSIGFDSMGSQFNSNVNNNNTQDFMDLFPGLHGNIHHHYSDV